MSADPAETDGHDAPTFVLSCHPCAHAVTDFPEGSLSRLEGLRTRVHLSRCAACRGLLVRTKWMLRALRGLGLRPVPPPSGPPRERLLAGFRTWAASRGSGSQLHGISQGW